jgi:Mrp family chromosome partitioning ATPase
MLGRRARLPLLAEIAGPAEGARAWSLRRGDLEALGAVLPRLDERRVVLVAGEGYEPAAAAIALASAAAASGSRTILVDCGLSQPRIAAQVGLADAPGLHEYLRWEAEPAEILQPVALAGPATADPAEPLVCIGAGRPATKAETLLGLQSFHHMIEKLRTAYELVLLLSPPVLADPDSCLVVASHAEVAIAGLSAPEARGRAGRSLRAAIRGLPIPVLGAISTGP